MRCPLCAAAQRQYQQVKQRGLRMQSCSSCAPAARLHTLAAHVSSAAGASTPERIIDCHMHFYDPNRPGHSGLGSTGPLRRVCLSEQALALCGHHGVTGAVLVECSDPVEDNQWLLSMSDTDEFILGVVGHLEPGPSFCTNVSRFARHPRFVGVRPTPPRKSAHCSIEELRHLRDNGLVLDQMVVSSEQMQRFVEDLREVPGLRVVVNHMGRPNGGDGGERSDPGAPLVSDSNALTTLSDLCRCQCSGATAV